SASPPDAADAAVTPALGYHATVLGWSSWYGSYDMGSLGSAWCIDHGLHAPDPAFRYVPTAAPDVDADTAAAISWIVAAHGGDRDAVAAAAVMLVVHDLRHASYPFGVMDVDRLAPHDLAGFGGHEAEVVDRARVVKAEAWSHRGLRAPFHLALALAPGGAPDGDDPIAAGSSARDVDGRITATLTDAGGRPVVGAGVALEADGAVIDAPTGGATGVDGTLRATYRLDPGPLGSGATFGAHAIVPSPVPATYASSTVRAQRVVRTAWLGLDTTATYAPPPTTTSTSTSTTSTTSASTTTTPTTRPAPRPTIPPTSTSTTFHPRRSTTTTAIPPTSASTTPPPDRAPGAPSPSSPPTRGTLPRTGDRTAGWALTGAGLVLLGATLVAVSRGWVT
ncbi:MAG: Ig-like domain-containing protein, partial [Acidimicrobiales bacterium]